MIAGIGNDIVEISRVQEIVNKNSNFLSRYFTQKEEEYFIKRNNSCQTIAGNFAAKEAVSKALGTGFKGFGLEDIEVIRDSEGAPIVNLYGKAKELSKKKNIDKIWVSISHSKKYATAVAVAEISL